ncbi:DUF58 domain-containing protein [Arenimonas composti]|uniref:DUF58 domain-containing protein n=1 Tax=Arenimonas composti TR7-09 = DSM 18010 TaxID=1121013 RepID=A0A091BCQ5_9GAMM|nr:DUF58 domain-containing protein [Arenimonas composti]KFN49506.1 hypothetical protein P873_10640 [Arenimonas composti TR7-09 = DSM 18010]
MAAETLIPAEVRARLRTLRLAGRRAAGGDGFGQHRSRSRGAGLEFAQYRAYEPGDELRQIDWKLYARSDRFFVREAERDSPLTAWVVLDASASMGQRSSARDPRSRLDVGRALAACVFELALAQGDRCGLAVVGGEGLQLLLPADAGARARDRATHALLALRAGGGWPPETALRPLWERIGAGQLVIVLSDDFDEGAVALMERLSAARREVLNIQLLTADERDFPFRGGHRFRDPESGAERISDGAAARDDFLARFAVARGELAARLAASGVRHVEHWLDAPLDAPLRRLFAPMAGERG